MPKINPLTFEQVSKILSYDAEKGTFTWLADVARNVKAGDKAGCPKSCRNKKGKQVRYVYIRLNNIETPAARIAWLLHHGKFPKGNLQFSDGNTENLCIDNLKESVWRAPDNGSELKVRKQNRTAMRGYALKRYYGLSIETYNVMLQSQDGVCAICGGVETYVPKGDTSPKPLSVDHNHKTGQIRGLLCSNCNYVIGHCKEDRNVLLEAIKYLDKHSGRESAKPTLTVVPSEDTQ